MSELGTTIRAARKALGLRQAELARQFGLSRSAVNQWESGINRPDLARLAGLAEMLALDPALLVRLAAAASPARPHH